MRVSGSYHADVVDRTSQEMAGALALVAPGTPLREGLERVLKAHRGALVVVGDDSSVLSICTGGFLLDAEFSPQRLSELAKMDGAMILSANGSRIARANVHLVPSPTVPTSETGTRHRTAERVARSVDVPVISVSSAMQAITIYRNGEKHVLQPIGRINDQVGQALQTLHRFRERFDLAVSTLSALEVEDTVTVRDVVAVLQPAELLLRISADAEGLLVELGADGRLQRLQLEELVRGVAPLERLVLRDYVRAAPSVDPPPSAPRELSSVLAGLPTEDLLDSRKVATLLGILPNHGDLDSSLEPRGYRLLHRLPRFPEAIVERIVEHFGDLQHIMRAAVADLEQVDGVGEARARSVKEGLSRLVEASILDRYA
jgi:diadenylate cyclase